VDLNSRIGVFGERPMQNMWVGLVLKSIVQCLNHCFLFLEIVCQTVFLMIKQHKIVLKFFFFLQENNSQK
jgi:hypothetical protein